LSHTDPATTEKAKWSLTKEAFDKLLNAFSSDRNEAAAKYEHYRRKLLRFFEWRGIEPADEYADETYNRVARRIDEGQKIDNLISYLYAVARLVFMEALKNRQRAPVALDDAPQSMRQRAPEQVEPDARVLCLDRCLDALPPENRTLIIDYYQEERRAKIELRQELADRLNIPLNALRIRAHRIRNTLEQCINQCMELSAGAK
jgi:RNA polymerase sigma factor (sigma-70 family)